MLRCRERITKNGRINKNAMKSVNSINVYFDEDADLSIVKDKVIGIIGYGNQGRAWALNMRDSGLNVVVGNIEDPYREQARSDGFQVFSPEEAASKADIICLLIPDEVMPEVYENEISKHLGPGKTLCFASGYNITFKLIRPPEYVNVILIAPRMIGKGVRDLFVAGSGAPALVAVERGGQEALKIALSLAKALGFTRAGVFESSFKEEAISDLISEQIVGAATAVILKLAFEAAIKHGVRPEIEVLELYLSGEIVEIWKNASEMGLLRQMTLHSITSQYGQLVRQEKFSTSELKSIVEEIVKEIVDGKFAEELLFERKTGYSRLKELYDDAARHPMFEAEQRLLKILKRN